MTSPIKFFRSETSNVQNLAANFSGGSAQRAALAPNPGEGFYVHDLNIHIETVATDFDNFGGVDLSAGAGLIFYKDYRRPIDGGGYKSAVNMETIFGDEAFRTLKQLQMIGRVQITGELDGSALAAVDVCCEFPSPIVLVGRQYQRLSVPLDYNFSTLGKFEMFSRVTPMICM